MHDAYTPTTFLRFNRPLRAVLIDDQPWFAACDFGRLMGHRHPERIIRQLEDDQRREALLGHAGGAETTTLISESGLYKAFYRYQHPENRHLRRWLTQEVIPTLHDQLATAAWKPRRTLLSWEGARVSLLEWQGGLWVPLDELPRFSRQVDEPARKSLGGWLRR